MNGDRQRAKPRMPAASERSRRRRGGRRFALLIFLLMVILILAIPFFVVRIAPVRSFLLDAAAVRTGIAGRFDLEIARVSRCDPVGLTLEGVAVAARDSVGNWRPMARVGRVALSWSLRDLLAGRAHLRVVAAESLNVELTALAARPRREGPAREAHESRRRFFSGLPPVEVAQLIIDPISVCDSAAVRYEGALELVELQIFREGFFTHIERGRVADRRRDLELRFHGGQISMAAEGVVNLSGLDVATEGVRAQFRAQYVPDEARHPLKLFADCERLAPALLARQLGLAIPWQAQDSLAALLELAVGPGRMRCDLAAEGLLLGEPLSELSAVAALEDDLLDLSEAELRGAVGLITAHGRGDLAARSFRLSVDWQGVDPRSAWLPWLGEIPIGTRFSGALQADIDLPEGAASEIHGSARITGAQPWGLPTRELQFEGRIVPGEAVYGDRLLGEFPQGRLSASGRWPLDASEVALTVEIDSLDLTSLPEAWRDGATGIASGGFELKGAAGDPSIQGWLDGRGVRWRGWRADSLHADPLLVHPVHVRGALASELWGVNGPGARELHAQVGLSRWERTCSVAASLTAADGDLTVKGEIDPAGRVTVNQAALTADAIGRWDLARPFRGGWGADTVWADTLVLTSDASRLRASGYWQRETDWITADVRLESAPLNILARLVQSPDSIAGSCDLHLAAEGRLPDPRVTLALAYDRLGWRDLPLGSGELVARWEDATLQVGPVDLSGPHHQIRIPTLEMRADAPLAGLFGGPDDADSARTSGSARLLSASWEGIIEVGSLDLGVLAPLLGLEGAGDQPANGAAATYHLVAGQQVPVRVVTPWESVRGEGTGRDLGGTLQATIELGGSPDQPILRLEAGVPDLSLVRVPLGDLTLALTYADSLVTLERMQLARGVEVSWARGTYPIRIALLPLAARPLPDRVAVQIGVDHLDLALLSGVTRWLPDASGALSGQLALEGSGSAPELRGTLELADGGFRIPGRSERIDAADAVLDVRESGVRIRSLDARCGRDGTVTAVGNFDGPEEFDLSAHAENVRIFEEGRYEFLITADMHAYTVAAEQAEAVEPHLQGAIEIHSGTLTQSLTESEPQRPGGRPTPWIIDLDVEAPGNIRVSQVNAKADLGDGTLYVAYRWPYWSATGTIRILGGTYRLLNNTFTITEGSLEFRDTGAGPEVTAEIDAETYVAVAPEAEGPSETVTIQVHVYGKPEALEIDLSSTPPLSEEEIYELLSYGRFTRTGRFEPIAETQWILFNTMVDRIETSLIEQMPLFSRVTIGTGSSTEDPMRVTLRPIVRPGFMVNYSQELAQDPRGELLFDYRLSRVLYLHGGLFRHREGSGGLIDEYSLDLKFRFGYD